MLYVRIRTGEKLTPGWTHVAPWCSSYRRRGVVFITIVQLHLLKPKLRFCAGPNSASGVSEIRNGEDLW